MVSFFLVFFGFIGFMGGVFVSAFAGSFISVGVDDFVRFAVFSEDRVAVLVFFNADVAGVSDGFGA